VSIQEKPLRYGEGGRGFAMLTTPQHDDDSPIVVMLNAGLLNRPEPYRLNVLAARRLAEIGYVCVRVDLSGKGDTPPREGLSNRESVALDWKYLRETLDRQFGPRAFIIMGLCSGADNGIKLSAADERIRGLILLDARSPVDAGFRLRRYAAKMFRLRSWLHLPATIVRHLLAKSSEEPWQQNLRDLPRPDELRQCALNMVRNDGRMMMVFTSHAINVYNSEGQFVRAMGITGLNRICREHFWPEVEHLYPVEAHRERLLGAIEHWAEEHLEHLRSVARTSAAMSACG
jgi:pimeloyl-ACP methyl ester carboxylesterase